jgi:predicted nucleic acid-binding protein
MMRLIDTTVWIDFFAGRELPHAAALKRLIKNREYICICDSDLWYAEHRIKDELSKIETVSSAGSSA